MRRVRRKLKQSKEKEEVAVDPGERERDRDTLATILVAGPFSPVVLFDLSPCPGSPLLFCSRSKPASPEVETL